MLTRPAKSNAATKLTNQMRALKSMLDEWEDRFGPIPDEAVADAEALFDELDAAPV